MYDKIDYYFPLNSTTIKKSDTVTAESNLEWEGGGAWFRAEGAIHLERSERIGPGKF